MLEESGHTHLITQNEYPAPNSEMFSVLTNANVLHILNAT